MQTSFTSALITLNVLAFLLPTEAQPRESNDHAVSNRLCRIRAANPLMHGIIRSKLAKDNMDLIEYKLTFSNYSYNPLTTNVTRYHKADTWARVTTYHGQILLSLAFNYGVLSLMTLTIGTNATQISLEDIPFGCIGELPEEQRVGMVRQLLMRDFKEDGNVSAVGEQKVCNVQITNQSGYAKFTDYCCFVDELTQEQVCEFNEANPWLRILWVMLTVVRYGILVLGPLLFLSTIADLANQKNLYIVKLVEPLEKIILLSKLKDAKDYIERFDVKRRVNLNNYKSRDLPELMESIYQHSLCRKSSDGQEGELLNREPFSSYIYDYHILVSHERLLMEDEIPVGFWKLLMKCVFLCKLGEVGPFVDCCKQKICNMCSCFPWIKFWKAVGFGLLVLLLPMPYYLRLLVFYFFEHDELMLRKESAARLGLTQNFDNSLLHYLLPTHPLFISICGIYFTVAIAFALASGMKESPFRKIIVGSFDDLRNLSLVSVLHMMVSNIIWPFEKCGGFAIFAVCIYWPIVVPITCLVSVGYCIPTIYLTIRMLFYSETTILESFNSCFGTDMKRSQQLFEIKTLLKPFCDSNKSNNDREPNNRRSGAVIRSWIQSISITDAEVDKEVKYNSKIVDDPSKSTNTPTKKAHNRNLTCGGIAVHVCVSMFCVVAMYSVLIILSECIGCLVEIMVFTMMGIIVNAGTLLKYIALATLILIYVYDSFNNVEKKYLQLNKSLFKKVQGIVKGLKDVTSQPSSLQKNTGFKSQELSEQAKYEDPDDVSGHLPRHWFINDLVLFVDKEDVPRIPKKLFEEVCEIQVAGVPGPVYCGILSALRSFLKMAIFVVFVFLAILSFASAYGLSSTTQTIAALAGGSVPMLLKAFMKPPTAGIDTETVSFTNKLDEVVMNFYQFWPMNDFSFDMQARKKKEEGSTDKDAPIESANPVTTSTKATSEVMTANGIQGVFMLGPTATEQPRNDEGGITTLLRREIRRKNTVDIIITLPADFDAEWKKFCTEKKIKKDETTDPIIRVRGSRMAHLRNSSRQRCSRKGRDLSVGDSEREEDIVVLSQEETAV